MSNATVITVDETYKAALLAVRECYPSLARLDNIELISFACEHDEHISKHYSGGNCALRALAKAEEARINSILNVA